MKRFFDLILMSCFLLVGGCVSKEVEIVELNLSGTSVSVNASADGGTFSIACNAVWTAESNQTWCTVSPISGSGNSVVSYSLAANPGAARTATITVRAGDEVRTFTIVQAAGSPELSVSQTSFTVAATPSSSMFNVTCSSNWTAASSQNWCIVSPTSGSGNGTVHLTVAANTEMTQRVATITVRSGNIIRTVTITQTSGNVILSIPYSSISIGPKAVPTHMLSITSNADWTVSGNQDWCTVSPASGKGNGMVRLSIMENTSRAERVAILTVKAGNETITLTVTQGAANAQLAVSSGQLEIGASGSGTFDVTSNADWTALSEEEWCTLSPDTGSGDGTVTVTCTENPTISPRTATVTVKAEDEVRTVTVVQVAGTVRLETGSGQLEIGVSGSGTFDVASNADWTASSEEEWCTLSPDTGSGDGTVTVTCTENPTISPRTATVTVKAEDEARTVTVIQAGGAVRLETSSGQLEIAASAGSGTFDVTSNADWTVSSEEEWCMPSPDTGSGDGTVTVTCTENPAAYSRTATIVVKAGNEMKSVVVTQAATGVQLAIGKEKLEIAAMEGKGTFDVSSNTSWMVLSDQTWCKVSPAIGNGNNSVIVACDENILMQSRTATITIKAGDITKTVAVTQLAAAVRLTFDKENLEIGVVGGNGSLNVASNAEWTATCDQAWCTLLTDTGNGNGTLVVACAENTVAAPRTATITVKAGNGVKTVTVTQAAAAFQWLPTDDIYMPARAAKGGNHAVANAEWTATSDQGWCVVTSSGGSSDSLAVTTTEENASAADRTAIITLTAASKTRTITVRQVGAIELVNIPAGFFTMGSPESEVGRNSYGDIETQHQVTVEAFKMGKYEVSFAQYDAFCEVTGRKKPSSVSIGYPVVDWGRGNRPVMNVSWHDAKAFCDWMGGSCRLPTEAEWEYACRAGTETPFNTGNNLTTDQANYNGQHPYNDAEKGEYRDRTLPVGSFAPNAWGLYDMHGNVSEWCGDAPQVNPDDPEEQFCISRGGSWNSSAGACRSACKSYASPEASFSLIGFRIVKK